MTAAEMDIIIGADTQQAVDALKKLGYEMKQTEKTASGMAKKTGKDFTGLSRVIQDLPYGFNAISNNLTQLLPAAGAAGLAFSAIVSAVTFAQMGFGAWTRGLGSNKAAINDNVKALKEQKEALDETYKAAGQQYAQVAKLIEQSQLQVTTRQQQKKILEELKSINQEYFGALQVEGNAIAGLNAAYEAYGNNILKVARAKGAAESIEKLTKDLLATKDAVLGLDSNFTNLNLSFDKVGKFVKGQTGSAFEQIAGASQRVVEILAKGIPTLEDYAFLSAVTGKSEREISQILGDRLQLRGKEAQLMAQIQSNSKLIAANEIGSVQGIADKATKAAKDWYDAWKKEMQRLSTGGIVLGSFQQEIQKLVGEQGKLTITPSVKVAPFELTDLAKQAQALASTINGVISNLAVGVGEAIGNIFSGQGNPFASFLAVLGEGLKTLGKQLIEIGLLAQAVQTALKSLIKNPYLAIAAGVAAIALGQVLSNKAKNIKAFATGGVVTQPTLALVGEQGPERITPLGYEGSAGNMMQGAVQFVIRGQDLYGTLNRFTQNNRNIN